MAKKQDKPIVTAEKIDTPPVISTASTAIKDKKVVFKKNKESFDPKTQYIVNRAAFAKLIYCLKMGLGYARQYVGEGGFSNLGKVLGKETREESLKEINALSDEFVDGQK